MKVGGIDPSGPVYRQSLLIASMLQLWEFDGLVDLNMDQKEVHSEQVRNVRLALV